MWRNVVRVLFLLALAVSPALARVIHVPGEYPTIQQGIDAAVSGDIVMVAPGHYLEEINLKAGVVVQGAGEGLSVIDGGGNSGDVVRAIGNAIRSDCKLQGFTVTGAISGGGMPGGAGLFCNSGAAPDVGNNRFEGNDFGIATWNGSNPLIHNNVVCHNTFFGVDISSNPTVVNNTIAFNVIGIDDGGGYGPVVINNIVTDNSRYGVYAVGLQPQLTYNDVWGNDTNYRNCSPGAGSDSVDPAFADTAARDFHLQPGSPCINAGNPAPQYNDPDGTRNDMGAYGGPGAPALLPRVTTLVPGLNELQVDPATDIAAGFSVAMSRATLNDQTFFVSGSLSGLHRAQVSYDSVARLATLDPNHDFLTGEEVTAELTRDVASAHGDSFPGFAWQFLIAAAGGSGRFSDTTVLSLGDSAGWVVSADFNLDRQLDLAAVRYASGDVSVYLGNGDGSFQAPLLSGAPVAPEGLSTGDWNRDSIPDVVLFGPDDSVSVMLGLGDGHFRAPARYYATWGISYTIAADFDLDGNPDLAAVSPEMDELIVLRGNGDGSLGGPSLQALTDNPLSVAAGDLDRDGLPDLVIANTLSNNLAVLLGKGDATFDSVHYFPAGNGPAMVRLADFNEDGVLDAAVTDEFGDQVAVLIGSGTGSLSSPTFCAVQGSPVGLSVTDLDADGHLDLAVANMGSASISVLPGRGNGTFGTATHWSTPVEPAITTFGDFDSDMDIDLAVGCRGEQAICVLFNDNQLEVQSTTPARYAVSASDTTSVRAVFDQLLNPTTLDSTSFGVYGAQTGLHRGAVVWDSATRSALLDPRQGFAAGEFVIAQFTKALAARSGVQFSGYSWQFATGIPSPSGGAFASATGYPTAGEPRGMVAADFDSDGNIDIVTTGNSPASVAFLKNNGDGTFAAPVYTNVNSDPMAVLALDVDMDLDIDLAVYHNEPGSSHLEILKNDGSGAFNVTATYAPAILGQDITGADLDLDGDIDLILTDGWGSQDNVHVMLNNGAGAFTGPTTYSAGTFARGVVAQDANNDGWPDLAVANNGNDNVTVLLNDGTGHFPTLANYATGAGPNAVFAYDLNHDGWLDLVTTHLGGTAVSVLLNNGAGGFAAPVPYSVGFGQYHVTGGDFDGDGDIDLACSGYGTDSCVVLLNNGTGTFPDVAHYQVGSTPWGIVAADFNLDGALDLAVANYGNNNVSVLLATGLSINHSPTPNPQSLFTAFPNPFSDKLLILVPQSPTPGPRPPVSIYDASGRLVRTLPVPRSLSPAPCPLAWDSRDNSGNLVSPGVYFVSLSDNRNSSFVTRQCTKVVLTR